MISKRDWLSKCIICNELTCLHANSQTNPICTCSFNNIHALSVEISILHMRCNKKLLENVSAETNISHSFPDFPWCTLYRKLKKPCHFQLAELELECSGKPEFDFSCPVMAWNMSSNLTNNSIPVAIKCKMAVFRSTVVAAFNSHLQLTIRQTSV